MDQKKLTILTLFVVLAGAVSINEFVIRRSAQESTREMASASERYAPEQIKWEQELARTVAQDHSAKTVIGGKPSQNEKFLYEALAGRYQATLENDGKNLKISLLPNQTALDLNTDSLIRNYPALFKEAKSFEKTGSGTGSENVTLKNASGAVIGQVRLQRNDEGRVLNIEIQ